MVTIAMKLRALALAVVATALLAGAPVHGDDRLGDENRILLRTAARAPDGQSTGPATPAWVRYAAAVPATASTATAVATRRPRRHTLTVWTV